MGSLRSFPASALLIAVFMIGCSQPENSNSSPQRTGSPAVGASVTPANAAAETTPTPGPPPASGVKSLPPEGGDIPRPGEVDGYTYTYKKDATKTVATFSAKLLPADNNSIHGAVRDVIERSYGDHVDSAPRMAGSGPSRSMRISSKENDYVIVLVQGENRDILALIITQMEKETPP